MVDSLSFKNFWCLTCQDGVIVTACTDGLVRVYDVKSGHCTRSVGTLSSTETIFSLGHFMVTLAQWNMLLSMAE